VFLLAKFLLLLLLLKIKVKLSLCFNSAPRHEDILESVVIALLILDLGIR